MKEASNIDVSAVLAHVHMLETKLPRVGLSFGHPEPPQLYMSRIPDPDKEGAVLPVFALMAVSKRCISAQLVQEASSFAQVGPPVEVLVISGEDEITCAAMIPLELQYLTASDTGIDIDDEQEMPLDSNKRQGLSLLSGGLSTVAPSPRLAIVVGTVTSRVVSIEFSVKSDELRLIRRKYYIGKEEYTYLEPLPSSTLSEAQKRGRVSSTTPSPSKQSKAASTEYQTRQKNRIVPFAPSGGVTTLAPYNFIRDGTPQTHVWISFGDGTGIRLHHAGFFASVIQKHTESQQKDVSLEYVLGERIVRWQAMLPPMPESKVTMIPLPRYTPSPLAPFPAYQKPEFDNLGETADDEKQEDDLQYDGVFETAVYCSGAMADVFPTLAFYTSEDQFEEGIQHDLDDDGDGDDGVGLVGAVIGGIFGLLVGSSSTKKEEPLEPVPPPPIKEVWDPAVPFPSMNLDPIKLYAGYEIHDPPRQITSCSIDPEGNLAAITDTLGRVSLIDLASKQIVRMWKGYRDSVCHWIQTPRITSDKPWLKQKVLYLVIHSRQRKVVEVWRTRHGPKVKTLQVGRETQLLSCKEWSSAGQVAACYLAHSTVPHSSLNQVKKIEFKDDDKTGSLMTKARNSLPHDAIKGSQEAAMRLNRLKQMLDDTNVECQSSDAFKALERIQSIEDLATALDFLAVAPTLEERMGVDGSTFQKLAVSHCKQKLDEAISTGGKDTMTNPHIQLLAFKIAYYTQIINAYDILHRYEMGEDEGNGNIETANPSKWSIEAAAWTAAYEKITKTLVDKDIQDYPRGHFRFYAFASACVPPKDWMKAIYDLDKGGYKVYLHDSSKTRKEILVRIFKPLLGDVFSFKVVNQLFESLGIKDDNEYLLKCFGEWFTSLSVKDSNTKAIFAKKSGANRWLKTIVFLQLDQSLSTDIVPMDSLYEYCRASTELVRAFWLATLCREAMFQAAKEKEEKTYGKISVQETVGRWDSLLRKLRVCLLVSLRLNGIQLGACPISIKAVDEGDNFSVFEWLAQDELHMSQNNDEIVSLENACKISSHAFDPSTQAGDDRYKELQSASFSKALSEEERAEYLVDFDDDDRLGALLLFLKGHNKAEFLVAHRALILASKWGRKPKDLRLLQDALVCLKAISVVDFKRLSFAVTLEIWQSRIRPVYRALLMGFDDVQEVSQEVIAPLLSQDSKWVESFSKIASSVLDMLSEFKWHQSERVDLWDLETEVDTTTWPPIRDCFLLKRLVLRSRPLISSSINAHLMMIKSLRISKDASSLSNCIPSFYDLFTPNMIFTEAIPHPEEEAKQHAFLQDAIVAYARSYKGPPLESLHLGDVEILADLWEFDMVNVRTLFLLSMYEFGKDTIVDEVLTKSASLVSVEHFCDDGVDIICRRLNYLLHVQNRSEIRNLMGSLDADLCDWVREKGGNSEPLVDGSKLDVSVGSTHLFGLRLLSLAASAQIPKDQRVKIHSLIVLSGTIVKSLEGN